MSKILGNSEPVELWREPWEYERWRAAVLNGRFLAEDKLQALYAEKWEPKVLYQVLADHNMLRLGPKKPKLPRRVVLDQKAVERRVAKAIWLECSKLLVRRMTPDARQWVCDTSGKAQKAAGIEIVARVYE